MKNRSVIILSILVVIVLTRLAITWHTQKVAFEKHESLVAETSECLDLGEWNCAEKGIRALLAKSPDDTNLQKHLAIILYEQERYEECRNHIADLKFNDEDMKYLDAKVASLIREMEELGIERSMHFRVEFEGHPKKSDVMEALAVLEVAYDSLTHLFDFRPENKLHLVLYQSQEYQGMGPRPDWVGAVFDGKLRVPVNVMQYREVYRPMLFHELTHAFVRAMTRASVPLWMNEGIAQVVDASRNDEPRPDGTVPSLKSLTEPFVNESSTDVAKRLYWYSQKMVEELLQKDGGGIAAFPRFRACVQELRVLGVDKALQKYYGVNAEQLLAKVR